VTLIEQAGYRPGVALRSKLFTGCFSMTKDDLRQVQEAVVARKHYDLGIREVLGGPVPPTVCRCREPSFFLLI
jgi:hypothetical protein